MDNGQNPWRFETLAQQDDDSLERILKAGAPIKAAEVAGYEFRGWNMNPATAIIGTRKFKKGFYQDPATGGFWGYNVRVKPGEINEPWVALPSEQNPQRFYFFGVSDASPTALYPTALIVDYRRWPKNLVIDPVRYTVDYLVAPDPANKDLLLGKSYSETLLGNTFLGYFILVRNNLSGYVPQPDTVLNDAQRNVLRAILECQMAVLQPEHYSDDLKAVAGDVEGFLKDTSADARCLVALVLEKIAADTLLHPFWELDIQHRRAWLDNLLASPITGGKQMRDLLGVVLGLGWLVIYSRAPGRALFGASRAEPIHLKTKKPAEIRSVKEPANQPDLSKKYRVCIIGSGAGGALMAARLAEAGVGPVLVVEAGKWISPEDYPRLRDDTALRQLYMSGGVQPALSSPIPIGEFLLHGRVSTINVLQGSLVGGGPAVNNAICFRMSRPSNGNGSRWPEWEAAGVPFNYDQLKNIYDIIHGELQLDKADVDGVAGWRSALFAAKANGNAGVWDTLNVAVSEDCVGCGGCNTGCRYGHKHGGLGDKKSYLERALQAGAIIGAELKADRFEMGTGRPRRLIVQDLRRNLSVSIEADVFVLAAGPLASTSVLSRSGLGLRLPLGSRASANVVTPVYGVFPNPKPQRYEPGLQMCYYAGQQGVALRETWFHYPGSIAVSLPAWFEENYKRIKNYSTLACLGVVVPTGPHGSVGADGRLSLKLDDTEFGLMKQGIVDAASVIFKANATQVYLASKAPVSFDPGQLDDLPALVDKAIEEQGDLALATAHPQGGNPLSTNPALSVVGGDFQVRGIQGLFVADASLFPSPCGVNPMMTTLALAHMAAEKVLAALT